MSPVLFLMFMAIAISAITLGIALYKKDAPKSHFLIVLSLLVTIYTAGRAFEACATGLDAAYHGVILAYFGTPYVPAFMLFFLLDYYGIKVTKPFYLLLLPSVATTTMVILPPLRHLYYIDYSFFPGPPIAQVMVAGSVYYYAVHVYFTALLAASLALSLWMAVKSSRDERRSNLTVFVSVFLPMLSAFLYLIGVTPMGLDYSATVMCFSVGLLGVAVFRLNLLRVLPLAKDSILEQMNDAFIIADKDNRYVESNATAQRQLPFLKILRVGQKLDLAAIFPGMAEGLDGRTLVTLPAGDSTLYFHLTESKITQNGKLECVCYTLHDVTDTRRLMSELKSMATFDAMTGIYNRASFLQLSAHHLEMAREQNTPLTALAIDIDRFKEVNDTYGHFGGDQVIITIVGRIAARLRTGDVFGRVGGDEFTILLPGTSADNATVLAKKLRDLISNAPIPYEDQAISATISIGLGVFDPARHANLEALLLDVDTALYLSKNTGRNKVSRYRV